MSVYRRSIILSKLKKIGILFIFLVMILPLNNVFANSLDYNDGYFDSHQETIDYTVRVNDSSGLFSDLIDNDLSTGIKRTTSGESHVTITFIEPIDISHLYAYFDKYEIVVTTIADETFNLTINQESYTEVNYTDVTKISIILADSSQSLYEFELFTNSTDTTPPAEVTNLQQYTTESGALAISYDLPIDDDLDHVNIYRNNTLSSKRDKIYNTYGSLDFIFGDVIKVTTVDTSGNESEGVSITLKEGDTTPPANVTNVKTTVTSESVKLTYDLPLDEDFSHLEIHRDSKLVADNVVLNSYVDSPLLPDTHYVYTIKSVDVNGNVSSGEIVGVTTVKDNDIVPPDVPTGLDTTIHNSALSINWNSVDVVDLEGYNIYVNGVKHNSTLIKGTSYNLYNLENGVSYDVQVSAVDTSGNESELSSVVSNTPSMDALPIFKMGYSLEDVSKSVSNWFSEFWLILAFATSIPLSFLIANRVKSLFIA